MLSHLHGQWNQSYKLCSKVLRQLYKSDLVSEMLNIMAKVSVLVNVKYSIWAQVGITQNCTFSNVMQRQGQEKDKQAVRREQRGGGEVPPPPGSFILFLSSPVHPSALLLFFPQLFLWYWQCHSISLSMSLYSLREEDKHIFRKSTKGAYICYLNNY